MDVAIAQLSVDHAVPGGIHPIAMQLLFVGRGLDFTQTSDQALTRLFTGVNAMATLIVAVQKSGGGSVSCLGGIYTAANKGGNAIVAAVQSWLSLGAGVNVTAVLSAIALTSMTGGDLFLSLTTGSLGALTADVFVFGVVLD